jgi:hypothetical protein
MVGDTRTIWSRWPTARMKAMPDESVFYMRGIFPFASGRTLPVEFICDLKVLLKLQQDQLTALAQELSSFDDFLDKPTLKKIVKSFVPNEDQANILSKLILHIDEMLRKTTWKLQGLFNRMKDTLQASEEEGKQLLTPAEFDEIQRRMVIVIKKYSGLTRQAKAQRLSELTGLHLESVEVICDLRPVFDEERESVEGIIPYTILKVVCTGPDGLPVGLEAILSQANVEELAKKSSAALKKLDRLRTLLSEKELPIPPVPMAKKGE